MSTQASSGKSRAILDKIKNRDRDPIVDVNEEEIKLVIFSLRKSFFAFYGADLKEVLPKGKINYVPGSPDYILGITNVRGDVESVIDINGFLELPPHTESKNNRIIIAEKSGVRSGILVDSVEDVLDIPKRSITPPLSTLSDRIKPFVAGETSYRNHNVTVLDIGRIFKEISGAGV